MIHDYEQLEFDFVDKLILQPCIFDFIYDMPIGDIIVKMYVDYIKYGEVFCKIEFPPYQLMLPLEFDEDI